MGSISEETIRNRYYWRECLWNSSFPSDGDSGIGVDLVSWVNELKDMASKCGYEEDCCSSCADQRLLDAVILGIADENLKTELMLLSSASNRRGAEVLDKFLADQNGRSCEYEGENRFEFNDENYKEVPDCNKRPKVKRKTSQEARKKSRKTLKRNYKKDEVGNYVCEVCGYKTEKYLRYWAHKDYHHTEHESVTCEICGKEFRSAINLRSHKHMVHTTSEFACKLCGKNFKHKPKLETHLKIHVGVKDHKCLICGSYFREKSNVKEHIVKVHKLDGGSAELNIFQETMDESCKKEIQNMLQDCLMLNNEKSQKLINSVSQINIPSGQS